MTFLCKTRKKKVSSWIYSWHHSTFVDVFFLFVIVLPFISGHQPMSMKHLVCVYQLLVSLLIRFLRSLSQGSTNSNLLDVQGNHKKRVRRSSLLNAKKLYEDAQMARKVKQYLAHLEVETDEEKFQIMSLQCEATYSTRAYPDQYPVLSVELLSLLWRVVWVPFANLKLVSRY